MKNLGLGLMRLPVLGGDLGKVDQRYVNEMVDRFLARGFTYFDTAYIYHKGASERAVKEALVERHPREAFQIASKMPTWLAKSAGDYPRIFQKQLERTGAGYFDYYLLHDLGKLHYQMALEHGGFDFAQKLKDEGKVKSIGFSFHDTADILDRILTEHPEMEFVQLQINYVDWDDPTIQARKCYETARKHNKPVVVMEPVKGGVLANVPKEAEDELKRLDPSMSPAQWALRFAASLPGVSMVLSGMSNFRQLEENMDLMDRFSPLSEVERAGIFRAADAIKSGVAIPCTACNYCVDGCPKDIPIPHYFALFNDQARFRLFPAHEDYYLNLAANRGKAGDCVACGQCEGICPQRIGIVDRLKDVAKIYDGFEE